MAEHEHCDMIVKLSSIIIGNGVKGLAKKVEDHEEFILKMKGVFLLLGFIGITNLIIIFKMFVIK